MKSDTTASTAQPSPPINIPVCPVAELGFATAPGHTARQLHADHHLAHATVVAHGVQSKASGSNASNRATSCASFLRRSVEPLRLANVKLLVVVQEKMHAGLNAHPALNRPANLPAQRLAQLAPGRAMPTISVLPRRWPSAAKTGMSPPTPSSSPAVRPACSGVDQPDHLPSE